MPQDNTLRLDLTANGFVFKADKVLLIYNPRYNMWLGSGGHLDPGETFDQALIRKIKKETALDVRILSAEKNLPISDNTLYTCPLPFHADVHNVGDHNHYAQYYICVQIDTDQNPVPKYPEIEKLAWFTEAQVVSNPEIKQVTKNIAQEAFQIYNRIR